MAIKIWVLDAMIFVGLTVELGDRVNIRSIDSLVGHLQRLWLPPERRRGEAAISASNKHPIAFLSLRSPWVRSNDLGLTQGDFPELAFDVLTTSPRKQ